MVATLQGIALVFAGTLLDGGEMTKLLAIALLPYWLAVGLIVWRRSEKPTRSDRFLIKYLYLVISIAGFFWQAHREI